MSNTHNASVGGVPGTTSDFNSKGSGTKVNKAGKYHVSAEVNVAENGLHTGAKGNAAGTGNDTLVGEAGMLAFVSEIYQVEREDAYGANKSTGGLHADDENGQNSMAGIHANVMSCQGYKMIYSLVTNGSPMQMI